VAEPPGDGATENARELAALEDPQASDKKGAPAR